MSELSLAKAEHRRAMYWRQSALRMVSSLERQLAAARLKGDVDALQLAQKVVEAERVAHLPRSRFRPPYPRSDGRRPQMKISEVSTTDPEVLDPDAWDTRFGEPPIAIRQAIVACRRATQQKGAAERASSATLDELADLRRRLDQLEGLLGQDCENLIEGIGEVLPRFFDKRLAEAVPDLTATLTARINALDEKVADLEARQLVFKGVWREGTFEPNSLVVKGGGLWLSRVRTTTAPGSNSDDWQLCTKSGQVVPKELAYA
jgi:hypothetical protein